MSKKQLALSVMFRLKKFQTALGKATKRYMPFYEDHNNYNIDFYIILLPTAQDRE
jgi:hypothetical protein